MDSSKESRSNRNSTGSSHGGAGDEEPTLPPARSSSRSLSERTYSLSLSEGGRSASASVLSGMGTPLGEDYDDEDFDEEGVLITSASKGKTKSKAAKKVNW